MSSLLDCPVPNVTQNFLPYLIECSKADSTYLCNVVIR